MPCVRGHEKMRYSYTGFLLVQLYMYTHGIT